MIRGKVLKGDEELVGEKSFYEDLATCRKCKQRRSGYHQYISNEVGVGVIQVYLECEHFVVNNGYESSRAFPTGNKEVDMMIKSIQENKKQ